MSVACFENPVRLKRFLIVRSNQSQFLKSMLLFAEHTSESSRNYDSLLN